MIRDRKERNKEFGYWRERIVDICVCNVSGIHQTKKWIVGEILKVSHSKILCLSSSNCCKWDYLIWCCNFLPPFTSQLQLMKLQPLEGHIDLKVVKLLICLGYNHIYEPSPYKQKKPQLVQLCLYYWRTNTQTYLHFFIWQLLKYVIVTLSEQLSPFHFQGLKWWQES